MDERERKGARGKRSKTAGPQKQRPDRYAHGPSDRGSGRRRAVRPGSGKRSSRARRRRRNAVIRWLIFIILILAAAGGFLIWHRYGASNERADREQYYGLDQEDEIAVVVNNEVVRDEADSSAEESETSPAPGKVYDGQYYIEYSVV